MFRKTLTSCSSSINQECKLDRMIAVEYMLGVTKRVQKNTFHEHLVQATGHAFECARQFVRNRLPESFQYVVHLNQSYDGNPLEDGEHVFPDDVARHGSCVGPLATEQVVELLWRDGLVPEWIFQSSAPTARTPSSSCFAAGVSPTERSIFTTRRPMFVHLASRVRSCRWSGSRAMSRSIYIGDRAVTPNHAMQRTRPSRSGCNRGLPWVRLLSLGR